MKSIPLSLAKIAAASVLVLTAAAQAEPLQFTLTGGYSASFVLNSNPVPDDSLAGVGFTLYSVPGTFPGSATGQVDLSFFNAALGGGFEIDDFFGGGDALVSTNGPQLYTGTESAPVFLKGSFALTDFFGSGATYTLNIASVTSPVSPVPEPATAATMLMGLALVGAALRRRGAQGDRL